MFLASFDRPNIRYAIVPKDAPQRQLLAFLQRASGRERHRLLPEPRHGRGDRRGPESQRHPRPALSRRARPGDPLAATRTRSSPRKGWCWSRPSPSAWASTSRMCASSCISTCRAAWRRTTRRPAAPGATACRPRRCCSTACRMWCLRRHMIDQTSARRMTSNASSTPSSTRCWASARPPPAAARRSSRISARRWPSPAAIATPA